AEGNGTSVFIDWTDYPEIEYEGDSESEIAFYRIYQSSTAFSKIFDENVRLIDRVEAQKKSITVSGLVRNEVYHYAIVAEDRFGLALSAVESTATSPIDRKSTRLNSSHVKISYAVFCSKEKEHHGDDVVVISVEGNRTAHVCYLVALL